MLEDMASSSGLASMSCVNYNTKCYPIEYYNVFAYEGILVSDLLGAG